MWLWIFLAPSCYFLRASGKPQGGSSAPSEAALPDEGLFPHFSCFLKLGEWQLNLQGINESTIPKVLQYYSAATEHDRSWYKVILSQGPGPR